MAEKIKITFLGTGGMIPTEKRNHPAFFLSYANEGILVDCGEGTQIQFRKARLNPGKITKILVTHRHGDHTFGLPGLFRTLAMSDYKKKLIIYGPKGIKKVIDGIFQAFGSTTEYQIEVKEASGKFFETKDFFLEAEKMIHGQKCNAYSFNLKGKIRIDKKKIQRLKIREGKHLQQLKKGKDIFYNGKKYRAKDLVFMEKGKKISFVLDTSMNDKIIPFVKNSDALICESGFGEELSEKAKEYQHLTASQAGEIARKAMVKSLYLVHISERYSKNTKPIIEQAKKHFKKTIIPNDLDSVEV
ncbi:MAG: ribonuclease Z [Nanoarchaeota archaeon]|mgnify:FL=1